jgi:hypothetical protein
MTTHRTLPSVVLRAGTSRAPIIRVVGHAVADAGLLAFELIPAGFNAKTQRCKVAITKTNLDPIR